MRTEMSEEDLRSSQNGQLAQSLFTGNEFERAAALFNQNRYFEALDAFENFEREHPQHALAAEAAFHAGWCYYRLEYYGQAFHIWERTETMYSGTPSSAQAAWATADTYFRAGQYEKALVIYCRIFLKRDTCKEKADQCRQIGNFNEAFKWDEEADAYQRKIPTHKLVNQLEHIWKVLP